MKILIISSTPWDDSNSFGNTFSNLFTGMDNVEIYNLCCKNGKADNRIVVKALQMTDKSVLKSIFKIGYDPVWEMTKETAIEKQKENAEVSTQAKKSRNIFAFMIRDCIWKLGTWKRSKTLNAFLEELKPDVIYLPIYAAPYMCDIQSYIIDKLGVSVVGHISDDVYGYPPKTSIVEKWYRDGLRKKLRNLISRCSYLEVFAQNMKTEYEELFNIPCFLIGKGVREEEIPCVENLDGHKESLTFVYTGNLGSERYKVLAKIGDALEALQSKNAVLDIYSATELDENMEKAFAACPKICFKGAISKEEVDKVQRKADFLVHVESFSEQAIFSAKMSFSTKIIDYMMAGKPIFAVGPEEVNSITVLQEKELAVVAASIDGIETALKDAFENKEKIATVLKNVENYLHKERVITNIQSGIKERLTKLIQGKKNEGITD